MSITVGIYDLYAYTIPGFLYLYVVNEFFRLCQLPYVDINQVTELTHAAILAVIAFILGHLFDFIAHRSWVPLTVGKPVNEKTVQKALREFKRRHPDVERQYSTEEWRLLYRAIKIKDSNLADSISRQRVIATMLQNISFGLLLLSLVQITIFVLNEFTTFYLIYAGIILLFSVIAIRRSTIFIEWYLLDIFETTVAFEMNSFKEKKFRPRTHGLLRLHR